MLGVLTGATTTGPAPETKVDPATPDGIHPNGQADGWTLTMSEEFNGPLVVAHAPSGHIRMRPDGPLWRTQWADYFHDPLVQNPHTCNPHHPEQQVYLLPNVTIAGGQLHFTAHRLPEIRRDNPWPTFRYTSGCVTSHPGHNQDFGFFEARIRTPGAPWWPAFWMLPQEIIDTTSPAEIDILEGFHTDSIASTNLHVPGASATAKTHVDMGLLSEWHTYAVMRSPTEIRWYFDGVEVAYETNAAVVPQMPMCMLLNLAIDPQAVWPDPTRPYPDRSAVMDIDHVRVWA